MTSHGYLFLGIGGNAVAIDRTTGAEVWRRKLKSTHFVTVHFDGEAVYAAAAGQLFCLDPSTGEIRWHNALPRLGMGVVCFGDSTPVGFAAAIAARIAATAATTAG